MLDPRDLFELTTDLPELDRPVLVQALTGFIDAGSAGRLARQQLLEGLDHQVVATFDVDQLLDYRSRRPLMLFVRDHWESYDEPSLALHLVRDLVGAPFLLLAGPEPDVQWERFVAAVRLLAERFGTRLSIGLTSIPMAVPHTRPIGLTAHGTRPDLVAGNAVWVNTVQVPASAGNLLEYRMGQAGQDAMGFAVHVPHYLAQLDFPPAGEALIGAVARAGNLVLPTDALRAMAVETLAGIEEQVRDSEEVAAVVRALEQQYDAYVSARGRPSLADEAERLPSADELGAELERFLAEHNRPGDGRDG